MDINLILFHKWFLKSVRVASNTFTTTTLYYASYDISNQPIIVKKNLLIENSTKLMPVPEKFKYRHGLENRHKAEKKIMELL